LASALTRRSGRLVLHGAGRDRLGRPLLIHQN
jgi:hypothetical protein